MDLHIHSYYSKDSLLSPKLILKLAKKYGLNIIAVTDHNTIKGGLVTRELNKNNELFVIVGAEIKTDVGDIIGLFLEKEIKSRTWQNVLEEIHEQGGITVLAHPFKSHKLTKELIKRIDIIEGLNGRLHEKFNKSAQKLAKEFNKPTIAGSDAHLPMGFGRVINIIKCDLNKNSIKMALLENKVIMVQNAQAKFSDRYLSLCIKGFRIFIPGLDK